MGLDLSHGNFSRSYAAVHDWRMELLRCADIEVDEKDDSFTMDDEDPLYVLAIHSDCDGEIENSVCEALANRLEELLPKMQKRQDISREFIAALREAAKSGDNLEFL